jgi:cytochrome b6-f complex iron-sulfur subunit
MTETEPSPLPPSAFLSRRGFIQLGLAGVCAAWAGTYVQSRLFPAGQTEVEAKPVSIPLVDLPVGSSQEITFAGLPVLVLRTPQSIKAFSLICTHLGCTVEWRQDHKDFFCPCHDGYFDQFGEVTAGPPPVPLEQFPVKVVDEQVIVGEEI